MIFLMKAGTSIPVGQAVMQGASKRKKATGRFHPRLLFGITRSDIGQVGGELFGV
jgi:hypothetical protein